MEDPKAPAVAAIDLEQVDSLIHTIRGVRVMLDSDLASLYGVETRILVRAVGRNASRFPTDFMFRLTADELERLRSQIGISNARSEATGSTLRSQIGISKASFDTGQGGLRTQFESSNSRGGRRNLPYAFTEQGVAMLSSVLRSPQAVAVNIEIMRAFVRMRGLIAGQAELARRLDELEARYDEQFSAVFDAIRELMTPPAAATRKLGF